MLQVTDLLCKMLCCCRVQPVAMRRASAPLVSSNLCIVTVQIAANFHKSARLPPCCLQIHQALLLVPLQCLVISLLDAHLITSRLLSTDQVQMLPPLPAMQPCCPQPPPLPSAVTHAATALLAAGCLSGRFGPDFCYLLFTVHTSDSV